MGVGRRKGTPVGSSRGGATPRLHGANGPETCAPAAASLLRTLAGQNHAHGLEQDDDVEEQRVILDVVEVVLQLLDRVVDRRAVVIAHLRPSGDTGLHAVPHRVIGNLAGELVYEVRALGAWPDKAHVAA